MIHPVERFVEGCSSPVGRKLVSEAGSLEGGEVVAGFSIEIAQLFAPWDWQ